MYVFIHTNSHTSLFTHTLISINDLMCCLWVSKDRTQFLDGDSFLRSNEGRPLFTRTANKMNTTIFIGGSHPPTVTFLSHTSQPFSRMGKIVYFDTPFIPDHFPRPNIWWSGGGAKRLFNRSLLAGFIVVSLSLPPAGHFLPLLHRSLMEFPFWQGMIDCCSPSANHSPPPHSSQSFDYLCPSFETFEKSQTLVIFSLSLCALL